MGSWNYQQEISPEAEESIVREVFPELLEASELGQETEQESLPGEGRYMQRRGGRRNSYASSRGSIRRPAFSARYSGRNNPYRSRNTARNTPYSGSTNTWNAPYPANAGWQQSPMGRWGGAQGGGMDSDTRRALRVFQSRRRLPVTGALDNNTLQTLLAALNQQAAPPADNAPPPDAQAPPPAADSASPPDNTAPPDDPSAQGDATTPAAPGEFGNMYGRAGSYPGYKMHRHEHFRNNNWQRPAGDVFPGFLGQDAWPQENEAPDNQGQGTQLTCRPAIVLDGFRVGDYTIRRQHYAKLLTLTRSLPGAVIVIRGHTDNQGDAVSNIGLSVSRAFEVKQWLTLANHGKPIAKRILVDALGATAPVTANTTEAGRSRNRRVEIIVCSMPPPPPQVANTLRIDLGGAKIVTAESEGSFGEIQMEDSSQSWYYIDAYNTGSGTPQKLKSYGPWQDTAAGAARVYDGMCGQFQSNDPSAVAVRCYVWLPTSQSWVACRNSLGFPGTMFCGRLDRS